MRSFPKPNVIVSACLAGQRVRHDAQVLSFDWLKELEEHVHLIPLCPEMGMGLGVPRPPIRIEWNGHEQGLIERSTGRQLTDAMSKFSDETIAGLPAIDGGLMKRSSPSCAVFDAKVYSSASSNMLETGPGLFLRSMQTTFPHAAYEDEGRLSNRSIREAWLTRIFLLARFRSIRELRDRHALVEFHASHKFLLLGLDERASHELGRIVGGLGETGLGRALAEYQTRLEHSVSKPPSRGRWINVLDHIAGFFKKALNSAEKEHFRQLVEDYRKGVQTLSACTAILESWIRRFDIPYVGQQYFFEPFPRILVDAGDSGHPRKIQRGPRPGDSRDES